MEWDELRRDLGSYTALKPIVEAADKLKYQTEAGVRVVKDAIQAQAYPSSETVTDRKLCCHPNRMSSEGHIYSPNLPMGCIDDFEISGGTTNP
jgi:hypothetical protein